MDNSSQEMGPNIFAVAENTNTTVPKKIGAPRRGPNNTRLSDDVLHYRAVSYTHLTLPTILLV